MCVAEGWGGVGWGIERVVKFTARSVGRGRGGRGLVRVGACVRVFVCAGMCPCVACVFKEVSV